MHEPIEDRNLTAILPLTSPRELKARLPISPTATETVRNGRAAIRDALHGRDDRLVVIVGPCSIHDPEAAVEYAERLREASRPLENELPVAFRLIRHEDGIAVFENTGHDFPQRILYQYHDDATMTASIEGPSDDGETRRIDFSFRRRE